jgi:hypothetical protein
VSNLLASTASSISEKISLILLLLGYTLKFYPFGFRDPYLH